MKNFGCLVVLAALALCVAPVADAAGDLEVAIVVSPNVINLESQGTWVTVHAEIAYSGVATATVMLNGIPVEFTKSDARGELVAKFCVDDVRNILQPGSNQLVLSGETDSGETFSGTDTIKVIRKTGKS